MVGQVGVVGPVGGVAFDRQRLAFGSNGGPEWTPAELSGLALWLDPSDLTTMFQDTAGTTPVTADGQTVGRINDKSGNGNYLIQATAANRPAYRTDGTLHWLQFDGVNDGMATAATLDMSATDEVTIGAGVRKTFGLGFQCLIELGTGITENSFSIMAPSSVKADYDFRLCTEGGQTVNTYTPPISNVLTCNYNISETLANQTLARINGASVTLSVRSSAKSGNFINRKLNIGARDGTSILFNGNIYSTVICSTLTTGADLTALDQYLAGKTGVTIIPYTTVLNDRFASVINDRAAATIETRV